MSAHVDIVCAVCGIEFCLPEDLERALRRSHESFWCPNGHSLSYKAKTDEEKTIEQLRRVIERNGERFKELHEDIAEWKLQARTCPFECGFRVLRVRRPEVIASRLAFHLFDEHGARNTRTLAIPERAGGER